MAKKKWYKRVWFWIAVVIVAFVAFTVIHRSSEPACQRSPGSTACIHEAESNANKYLEKEEKENNEYLQQREEEGLTP